MNYEPMMSRKDGEFVPYEALVRTSRWRTFAILAVVILCLAGLAWYFLSSSSATSATAATANSQAPSISITTAASTPIARMVSATGSLAARRELPVAAGGEGGIVTNVLVEPGTWVRQGQVLATIERSVQVAQANASSAQIAVAEANARIAQSDLDRAKALVGSGFIARSDVDRKAATRDAALAQVRVARAQLVQSNALTGRLNIRAPAPGLVLARAVEAGQVVGPGSGALFRIARDGEMELRAQLAEGDLAQVHVGDTATVTPVGAAQGLPGRVWQIAPIIDPQTRQGIVRIAIAYAPGVRPGGFASAKLNLGTVNAPLLPESAVQASDQGSYVYVINAQNKAEKHNVTVGDVSEAGVTITSGLTGNERVVVSAGAFLSPGEVVKPMRAPMAKP